MYTKYLTQHITIDYVYASDPNDTLTMNTASLDTTLAILPPLILKKTASTTYAHFHQPFQYHITFINPCDYPMYICFFDHLLPDTWYKPHSFNINHTSPMKATYLDHWISLGTLPPHTKCMVNYIAKIVPPLYKHQIVSQAEALYCFALPSPLMQANWFYAKSNLCFI